MRQRSTRKLVVYVVTFVALLASVVSATFFITQNAGAQPSTARVTGTAQAASIAASPQVRSGALRPSSAAHIQQAAARDVPFHSRLNARTYAQVKAKAKNSAPRSDATVDPNRGAAFNSFAGIQSSAAVCPPVGCNPPDMAVAASPNWVFQGVNTAFAVFDTHGNMQPGYPVFFGDFFGVPDPGACAGDIPFMSDPRAIYDPNDNRFIAAALEVEGAFGVNDCPFKTLYWIAVSRTSDPRGAWNVYAFDMSLGTTNGADFTMIGLDDKGVYFSANMFNQEGTAYEYAEIFGASKAKMEAGQPVVAHGFFNLTVSGPGGSLQVDTVQPALTEDRRGHGPGAEFFVDTFNGPIDPVSGHTCTSDADSCRGLAVWAFRNVTSNNPSLTFAYVGNTKAYSFAPPADQTTCTECIDSSDLRISATPVEKDGNLYAAWETGVNNGTQVVPGIVWSQLAVGTHDHSVFASQTRGGYYNFSGDNAVIYPALMPDAAGHLFMVFDRTSSAVNPEVRLTLRLGSNFLSPGLLIKAGEAPYRATRCGVDIPVCRWGDYSATSYDGFSTNNVYFAGQYANAPTFSRNWGTWIGRVRL
ncbi:MAG TPA: hypothetical protein VHR15_20555 [Ktedonobacterales bacterium]|jgi:hypothetical protein|nr:hypothetical protein [Ktedonobacterales bacterium]